MQKEELDANINTIPLFKELQKEEVALLVKHCELIEFNKGSLIIKQGSIHDGLLLILKGSVTTSAKILGGGTREIETLGVGDFLNEVSFLMRAPSGTSIVASSNVTCLILTRNYFNYLDLFSATTKYKIFTILSYQICSRLIKIKEKIKRIMSSIKMVTRSFFGEVIKSFTKVSQIDKKELSQEINLLKESDLFVNFTPEEKDIILDFCLGEKAAKYCNLTLEKNTCYIVLRGAVQSNIIYDNKVAKLSVIGPLLLFCNTTCVDENFITETIHFTTCENAILLKLTKESLEYLKINHPALWYKFYELICKSLIALEKSIEKLDVRFNIESYNR